MRIEPVHTESRRVEPVDRQDRRQQRRKDEERSERENIEEAYKLSLRQGKAGLESPFVPGAYSRVVHAKGHRPGMSSAPAQAGEPAPDHGIEPEDSQTAVRLSEAFGDAGPASTSDPASHPTDRPPQGSSSKPYPTLPSRPAGSRLDTYS